MFTRRKKRIYLDVAASSPASAVALKCYLQNLSLVGNPSSLHQEGVEAKKVLEDARVRIARLAQVRPHTVVFTSGATEANTLGIVGFIKAAIEKGEKPQDMHVLYHAGSHSSVIASVEALTRLGVSIEALALLDGLPDLKKVQQQVRRETILVALELVSGETGTLFDTRNLRRTLDRATLLSKKHIQLHIDASQGPRVTSYALPQLGADSLSLDAQKVGGVRGIGALISARALASAPILYGGPQEHGLRPGTENPALASAFARALEECEENRTDGTKRAVILRQTFLSELSDIKDMEINESKEQAAHIVNVSIVGRDTDYLLFLLDAKGIAISTKSACESGNEGSRMVALMTGSDERARSTIRISFGPETTQIELAMCATAIKENVRFLDKTVIY